MGLPRARRHQRTRADLAEAEHTGERRRDHPIRQACADRLHARLRGVAAGDQAVQRALRQGALVDQRDLPVFEDAAARHDDVVFGKVDTEAEQSLAAAAQITSIPTLMAFRDGILVFSQPGALPAPALEQVITSVKDLDMDDVRRQLAEQEAGQRPGQQPGQQSGQQPEQG